MYRKTVFFFFLLLVLKGCKPHKDTSKTKEITMDTVVVKKLNSEAQSIAKYVTKNCVIAHRGSTYFTPEESEPAFRWARNIGADYLEFDVQMTKDSALVAFHDTDLNRTTNVAQVFPDRAKSSIDAFTLAELRSLDVGSPFNKKHPKQARSSFKGLKIMTLRDVVKIAEGYRIQYKNGQPVKDIKNGKWLGQYRYQKDEEDNGNRPGIYVETKSPKPGVEQLLADELTALGWNINENPKTITIFDKKVTVANTKARLILQSFSTISLVELEKYLPNVPKCLLLWRPDMGKNYKEDLKKAIDFSVDNNIEIMGTSISGAPNNYDELTTPWITDLIHSSGMLIHPYTFDTEKQLNTYKNRIDGMFTNRADLVLELYGRKNRQSPDEILIELGY